MGVMKEIAVIMSDRIIERASTTKAAAITAKTEGSKTACCRAASWRGRAQVPGMPVLMPGDARGAR